MKAHVLRMFVMAVALCLASTTPPASATPGWNVSGDWKAFAGDLSLKQTAGGALSGTFRMKGGCTATYRVNGKIDGAQLSLSLVRSSSTGSQGQCAGTQTLKGSVSKGGVGLKLVLANFAQTSPAATFTGQATRLRVLHAITVAPTTQADAKVAVYNLIENNRETCPIVKWNYSKVTQGPFRGISHPGRGNLLWKVTVQIEWAGVSFFLHTVSWTVVGKQALPADMNPMTTRVYRDREAAWIGGGCFGNQPFGQS